MKKYCCETFKEFHSEHKKFIRGFSIITKKNGVSFLRFSIVDGENEEKFKNLLVSTKGKASFHLSINGEVAISFCPWCGEKLNQRQLLQ